MDNVMKLFQAIFSRRLFACIMPLLLITFALMGSAAPTTTPGTNTSMGCPGIAYSPGGARWSINAADSTITCSGHTLMLAYQADSDFVLYCNNVVIWENGEHSTTPDHVEFTPDGNLASYELNKGTPYMVWSTATTRRGARLILQGDGNLVIYNSLNTAIWATGTYGKC